MIIERIGEYFVTLIIFLSVFTFILQLLVACTLGEEEVTASWVLGRPLLIWQSLDVFQNLPLRDRFHKLPVENPIVQLLQVNELILVIGVRLVIGA